MIEAVVFDLGGVILESPFDVIAETERHHRLAPGFLNRVASRPGGAWTQHETGAIGRAEFVTRFEEECRTAGAAIDADRLLDEIESYARPRPRMMAAVDRLRDAGFTVAALTNNWESPTADWELSTFKERFDSFIESWVEGVRKPDPGIYHRLLERIGVDAGRCVFLDDIGRNLKAARELGMVTIKADDAGAALDELGALVGVRL